ncbi:MAG TPA: VOC family protein [Candidatus Thermoplasmatota archaeon]|nr:VOC family protein [Candidatus Thermoplasmatota archaeon]
MAARDAPPSGLRVAAADLLVRDLDRVAAFYRDVLGFRLHRRAGDVVELGAREVLLRLRSAPDARPRARGQAGLFHVAYLLPGRADLGRVLAALLPRGLLHGASDHRVSEALYLADPEGNGIELYRDRPREAWPRGAEGAIAMATDPLDVDAVLAAGDGAWTGLPDAATIGHIHLNVNDVPAAERFWREAVGLDLMARYGADASFLAADGYHHHLGLNAWGTRGGPPANPGTLGLARFDLALPGAARDALVVRLGGDAAEDPSGNRFRVVPG